MPTCENCGSHVTKDYVRVWEPDSDGDPRCCPFCEDLVRDGAEIRKVRSTRHMSVREETNWNPDS